MPGTLARRTRPGQCAPGHTVGPPKDIGDSSEKVMALVGGGLWWWKPSKSEDVPASACWGLVTAGDLRTLMDGAPGKAAEAPPITPTDLSGQHARAACSVDLNSGGTRRPPVQILVDHLGEARYRAAQNHETEKVGTGENAVLDFGAGVDGWRQGTDSLYLLLRCENGRPTEPGAVYRQIYLTGGYLSPDPPERERTQLFVDLARRTAAEVVRQERCPDVRIADRAPAVAG
ncbi:hypothetical protein [Kitasatospora purpeofusca]|uniref:hypothetical protein n=1 Tax=Kitasatospora purpeofusca TaxID=67352 RepID=UPI00369DAB29